MKIGKFSYGFILAVMGWVLSSFLIAVITVVLDSNIVSGETLNALTQNTGIFAAFISVIWIVMAIISGNTSRDKRKKSALWFVTPSFFVGMLVIRGCTGMLPQLNA